MTQDDDFTKEFLLESREGLDTLDGDLIALEEDPQNASRRDSAFRALHTIKGNSGFLDFHRLGELAHAGENVLQRMRSGDIEVGQSLIDSLLELIDAIRLILNEIESSGTEGDERFEDLERRLRLVADGEAVEPQKPKPLGATSEDEDGSGLELKSRTSLSKARQREDTSFNAQDTSTGLDKSEKKSGDEEPGSSKSSSEVDVKKAGDGESGSVTDTDDHAQSKSLPGSGDMGPPTVSFQASSVSDVEGEFEKSVAKDEKPDSSSKKQTTDDSSKQSDSGDDKEENLSTFTQAPGAEGPLDDFGVGDESAVKKSDSKKNPKSKKPQAKKPKASPKKKSTPVTKKKPEPQPPEPAKASDSSSPSSTPTPPQTSAASEANVSKTGAAVEAGAAANLVRVDVELLDRLMNLVGELVLARNQIVEISKERVESELTMPIQRLNLLTSELQDGVLKTRMQQIGTIWHRYPRMVRDFSRSSGKEIQLQMSGQETELDKSLVEAISDPLIHLIRNAIDHGIEKSYLRKIKGKPPHGQISLKASHESGQVHIEISDDGAGLDLEKIRKKAVQKGVISSDLAEEMGESDLRDSIFLPGFSTADQISNISGRGVGMDVVKTHVERVGGTIEIDTERDVGTTFRLTVPLTLAIIPALIVTSDGLRFAIAQTNVIEMLSLSGDSNLAIEYFHDIPVLRLRGEVLPVVSLAAQLESRDEQEAIANANNIMVLKTGTRQFALVVDEIGNSKEIVVKPFGKILEGMSEYGGATIMGDGSVALILDVRGIAHRSGLFATDRSLLHGTEEAVAGPTAVLAETSLLVAETASHQRIGLPLLGVVRLEEIPTSSIELSEGNEVIQYRGEILPLVDLSLVFDPNARVLNREELTDHVSVVVFSLSDDSHIGIAVHQIIDIAEHPDNIRPAKNPDVIVGTTLAIGKITDVISVAELARLANVASLSLAE
jgi:two-component system, chemotaxis family, sensor kinase CheA